MISRKHFKMIADELKANKPVIRAYEEWEQVGAEKQWQADVKAVAKALSHLNPRFNYTRFYEACDFENKQAA